MGEQGLDYCWNGMATTTTFCGGLAFLLRETDRLERSDDRKSHTPRQLAQS